MEGKDSLVVGVGDGECKGPEPLEGVGAAHHHLHGLHSPGTNTPPKIRSLAAGKRRKINYQRRRAKIRGRPLGMWVRNGRRHPLSPLFTPAVLLLGPVSYLRR